MGWPELAGSGSAPNCRTRAMRIGLEGEWLDRFGRLLGENGRWAERQVTLADTPTLGNPERLLDHAIELPNAVCRFHRVEATWTRCLILTFRYTALSDEKREGLVWLGFNLGTGARARRGADAAACGARRATMTGACPSPRCAAPRARHGLRAPRVAAPSSAG